MGTVTPETLLEKNSWIVWRGGLVEDFELVLDYRVSAQGNSGVGYRLAVLADDPFSVRGPQADIHGATCSPVSATKERPKASAAWTVDLD